MTRLSAPIQAREFSSRPACTDRLDLVDAAYTSPGSPESLQLRQQYCFRCPIQRECFEAGVDERYGPWGGTSGKQRTRVRGKVPR